MQPLIQRILEKIWYQPSHWGRLPLLPLSFLYRTLFTINKYQKLKQQQTLTVPVIVVGNINVGGTGKTPLVIYIAKYLENNNFKPCIITRGYKGKSKTWPLPVTNNTNVDLCGDEAKLMASRTQLPVIVGPKRIDSIHFAQKYYPCDIIISDDGLQHYAMQRSIELVVIDSRRRFGNKHLLPAGPLREKVQRLDETDLIVCNGPSESSKEHEMTLITEPIIALKPSSTLSKDLQNIVIMTGIGNPSRFVTSLEGMGYNIVHQGLYPDHYCFRLQDLETLRTKFPTLPIIMTEKDAVKCVDYHLDNFWYLPVTASLSQAFDEQLLTLVKSLKD